MGFKATETDLGQDKETMLGEMHGHKLILGLFSPVFRKCFYGAAKETKDVITAKQTTLEAFKLLIDFIYSKDIAWTTLSVLELYDVVNLAEKYDMPKLSEELKTSLEKTALSMDTVVQIADTAVQFTQFPDMSSALLKRCSTFIKEELKTPSRLFEFAKDQSGRGNEVTVLKLMAMIDVSCSNCRQDPCKDGQLMTTIDQFYVGCKVAVSKNSTTYWAS